MDCYKTAGSVPTPYPTEPQDKGPSSLLFLGVGNASPRCGPRACLMSLSCAGVEDGHRGRNKKHRNSTELLQGGGNLILRRGLVPPRILLIATTVIFQLPFRVPHSPCSEPLPLDSCLPSTAWPTFLPIFKSLIWFLVPFHSLLGRGGGSSFVRQRCASPSSHTAWQDSVHFCCTHYEVTAI